jgi:hypothetical protein
MKAFPWLAGLTAVLHTVFGTSEVHTPLLKSELTPEVSLLLYACWHVVTAVLISSSIVLMVAIYTKKSAAWMIAARFVGALWITFGFIFISVTLLFSNYTMLFTLGQWILLIPLGTLALLGPYKKSSESYELSQPATPRCFRGLS